MVSSYHAEIIPAAAPIANHGSKGSTSCFHDSRPRRHQKTTNSAPGNVAVTVLLSSADVNNANAPRYHDSFRVRSKRRYISSDPR